MAGPRLAGVRQPGLHQAGAQIGGGTGGPGGGSSNAVDITIADLGNHFGATNVEGALAEVAVTESTFAADLRSTVTGKGASKIGVENAGNWLGMAGTDLEGYLTSTVSVVGALNDLLQLYPTHAHGEGASLIGIEDAAGKITATTVEDALTELATSISARTKITDLADGTSGGKGAALIKLNDIGGNFGGAGAATVEDGFFYAMQAVGLRARKVDLADTATAKGASLIGIEDAASKITATTVEGALAELAAGTVPLTRGGTGQITAAAAFDALTVTAPPITCAATIDLSLASCPGHYVVINGNIGPVTSLGTAPAGTERIMRFASTPTLTHDAVALILPGGANIVAAAGDVMFVHSLGGGNWRCTSFMRAASMAAMVADLASVATAKGASLIGIEDAAGKITATTVEGALAELSIKPLLEYYATLAAPATSLTLSGLDGNTDGDYLIDLEMRSAVGSNSLSLQLNGAATNLDWVTSNIFVGAIASANWTIAQGGANPILFSAADLVLFQGRLRARAGRIRFLTALAYIIRGGATNAFNFMGRYNDSATNITSISIVAGVAAGLSAGSYIRMTRLPTTNPLA